MPQLLLAVGLLLALFLAARWFVRASPAQVVSALKALAVAGALLGLAVIVLTGRWGLIPFLLFVVLPWLRQFRAFWRAGRTMRGPKPGGASQVETPYLRLTLDHDTGALDGEVVAGAFAGRRLGALSIEELRALVAAVAGDPESVRLLEAYLDRQHPDWRGGAEEAGPSTVQTPSGAMSREEAYRILGLAPGAEAEAVREAHRRLMAKLHPDRGGTDYLAAKINQAKDVLLGA